MHRRVDIPPAHHNHQRKWLSLQTAREQCRHANRAGAFNLEPFFNPQHRNRTRNRRLWHHGNAVEGRYTLCEHLRIYQPGQAVRQRGEIRNIGRVT